MIAVYRVVGVMTFPIWVGERMLAFGFSSTATTLSLMRGLA